MAISNIAPVGVALLLFGCGSSLPVPELGPQPNDDFETVPYPPPAAVPEIVPEAPNGEVVWVDGAWVWRSRYYVWQRGGWVIPPPHAYYAPPDRRYGADGTLYFAEGGWRRSNNRERLDPQPAVIRPAASPPTPRTPEPALSP